jgi:phospholipid/cholesterol/gamma-HCH transport system ATP-binding protein
MTPPPIIQITNLTKSFNGRRVLCDINLTIHQGERVVIIGLSGSGKSLLLKHMIGLLQPDQGMVKILGHDWTSLTEDERLERRRLFGMVFQDATLFDDLTIAENVALPLELRQTRDVTLEQIQQHTMQFLAEVGLDDDPLRTPVELSGGMQKRVGIARALAITPQILLYDEPTAGLDHSTAEQISQIMYALPQQHPPLTSVTVTHDYACAALIADRLLYLDKQTGTLRELTADMQRLRKAPENEGHQREIVRIWLEQFFTEQPSQPIATVPIFSPFSVVKNLGQGTLTFVSTIGELLHLFFSMGTPLRHSDLIDRLWTLGVHSFPMILAAGFFIGMIGMMQLNLGVGELRGMVPVPLPALLSAALLNVLCPLFVGILLAGRVGSQISAEIGTKTLLKQIDALESFAIAPKRFLLAPIVIALTCATPLMTLLATFSGMMGAYAIWRVFGESPGAYWATAFRLVTFADLLYVLAKSALIGNVIGLVSYQQGVSPKQSSTDVARATTRAVVMASVVIVIIDFVVSAVYTRWIG